MSYAHPVVCQNASEFDVKFEELMLEVTKLCDERSRDAALASARRSLQLSFERFKRGEKIGLLEQKSMVTAMDAVRRAMGRDTRLFEQMADLEDFVDGNYVEAKR